LKIRSGSELVEEFFPETPAGPLVVDNRPAEIRRVVKRLRVLLAPHFESASRMGIVLSADDIQAVLDALISETEGLNPSPHLQCPEELREYLRKTMFEELAGEPSNVLYTTQVNAEVVRYEAMPTEFWKSCLLALRGDLERAKKSGPSATCQTDL